ncbi:DNA-binding transcriptional regulator, IscR family [Candidatus Hepatincolaceae symbiont of Richtersius coronifer]
MSLLNKIKDFTMKLGTRGSYATMAMIDIAINGRAQDYVSLFSIAQRNHVTVAYLEQLFIKLKRASLVKSIKGPKGGYKLARSPAEIFLLDIVTAVDERVDLLRCKTLEKGCLENGNKCNSHDIWNALMENINSYLASISLEEVILGTSFSKSSGFNCEVKNNIKSNAKAVLNKKSNLEVNLNVN